MPYVKHIVLQADNNSGFSQNHCIFIQIQNALWLAVLGRGRDLRTAAEAWPRLKRKWPGSHG